MTIFYKVVKMIIKHEGGYVNHPSDPGGETYKGIARRSHPNWDGWKIIDSEKKKLSPPFTAYRMNGILDKIEELQGFVEELYKKEYWDKMGCDDFSSRVSLGLFDFGVNAGPKRAFQSLQHALNDEGNNLTVDGSFGNLSKKVYKEVNGDGKKDSKLFKSMLEYRRNFYKRLAESNPNLKVFLNGWLNRVNNLEKDAETV
jgi:lysozyme family protein